MEANSYLGIAKRNLRTAKNLMGDGDFNDATRYAQQVVEKVLKHLLEQTQDPSVTGFMRIHNLRTLYTQAQKREVRHLPPLSRETLACLTTYYFDTNYPGDDYIEVTEEEAQEACQVAETFFENFLEMQKTP